MYDNVGSCSANYYYAVRLKDDQLNWSGIGFTSTAVHTLCHPQIPCEEARALPSRETTDEPGPARFEIARGTPTTLIGPVDFRFGIPSSMRGQKLSVDIIDVAGRVIRHMDGGSTAQARSSVHWDLRQLDGSKAPAGVYFMRATMGTTSLAWRLVLVR